MSTRSAVLALTLAAALPAVAAPDEPSLEELRRTVATLQEELTRLKATGAAEPCTAELERRIDLLAAEIEKLRTGGATEEMPLVGEKGLAPAAAKVYRRRTPGVSIGGYGEALYANFAQLREDDAPSGRTDQFDFVRLITYLGYKFSDSILLNSEIEFEHASTGKGGEASVEFAYLEFQSRRELGLRAGLLLVPVGFINELHEPPIFHGARRPEVETAIIPTTWRENGAGIIGEAGPFAWRAYVVAGLSSAGFSAEGIRGGRQSGARSKAEDFALTGRLDWTGVSGLLLGGSFYTGNSGQGATVDDTEIGGRVTLFDVHGQWEHRGLQVRGLWARSTIADTALVNQRNGLTGTRSVGEAQTGYYLEAAYDIMSLAPKGRWSIVPYLRYEWLDTQVGVPPGYEEDPAMDRQVLTAGLGIKPIPQVVVKLDFQHFTNEARTGVDQFNIALGFLF